MLYRRKPHHLHTAWPGAASVSRGGSRDNAGRSGRAGGHERAQSGQSVHRVATLYLKTLECP